MGKRVRYDFELVDGSYVNGSMVPGVDKAYAIAQALGCTPNDLMGWNTDEAA